MEPNEDVAKLRQDVLEIANIMVQIVDNIDMRHLSIGSRATMRSLIENLYTCIGRMEREHGTK